MLKDEMHYEVLSMNYHQYFPIDVVNGPGTRATLFVSGCEHQCRGCYNQSTWDPRSGHVFDRTMEDRMIADLNDQRIVRRGLSLSGAILYCPSISVPFWRSSNESRQSVRGKIFGCGRVMCSMS